MNANPLSSVSLMLTLAGLVGSFFNIQLSQWVRDLVAVEQKVQLNKLQGNETQQRAIVECRIELRRLTNWQTYFGNLLVLGFVVFVLVDGLMMISGASADPVYPNIEVALWVFLVFFASWSIWLMNDGRHTETKIKEALSAKT
jgi:hypothetical protein